MIKKAIQITNNMKLKHKLIISYILVVMIPVLIVGITVVSYFRAEAMDRAIEQTTNNVEKIKSQLGNMLRIPVDVSDTLLLDKDLERVVTTRYDNALELTKAYLAYDGFIQFSRVYREVAGIRFYYDNPTLINNTELIPVTKEVEETKWYQQAMESKNLGWSYIDDPEVIPVKKLSLIRQLPFPERRAKGVLMVSLDQNELNRMLSQEEFETLIADDQGHVVAAKDHSLVGKTLDGLDYGVDLNQVTKGSHKMDIRGEASYLIVDELVPESSANGLRIMSVFNTDDIVKDANRVSIYGLVIILLILLIALAFVYIVSLLTTNRLLRLSRNLNRLALGDLNVVSRIDGNDEVGQLSRQFNYMVESINRLMEQVVEKTEQNNSLELAQREIKLKMMASQINPHFLFNALESIRMNAHLKGEKEIANVVRLLGRLMRKNLEVGRESTPLKEEIDMVRSYLEIQKFRYEDRLIYELAVDLQASDIRVLPLIIQPLVENAVVHGVEDKAEGVEVRLAVQMKDDVVEIRVSDNGLGMMPGRLAEVRQSISNPEESGNNRIGLRNVHQRLVLSYGEEHGLNIVSEYGKGTEIVFTIPVNV
ncbi:two-component system sensor histidine kinase YesM [Fontibacillus phaseoli]|uniref:Two-component system sensor histidine kinase YesM n=1 Tax=Fontibacillus phaseoli TaxID=1416533 RepID=A0A369BQ97_9BACL|nr:histidine kinase [Fontibacillus phaseoli]RCX22647.1 two-component system sensor histidine kinase YesM [Fontibacillus phaseoli]